MQVHTFHEPSLICQAVFPGEYVVILYGCVNSAQRELVCTTLHTLTGKTLTKVEYPCDEGIVYIHCGKDKKIAYEVFDKFNAEEFPYSQFFGPYDLKDVWLRPYLPNFSENDIKKGVILRDSNH